MIWLLSGISAALYRMGGIGKPFKSWMRDWLIPAIAIWALIVLNGFHISWWWAYIVHYGLLGVALSTYWDFTGEDNFYLHGFFIGLAILPFAFCGIAWWLILIRAGILAVSIVAVIWCF